ncbi:MAG: hypothetical protein GWM98_25420 [Nitrospinaceae bacterium]|nr:hypothetical protein [Nitrospinaceae bacterium]NIR57203.1 hypothetical protein [Nitrospinaceae bacterium]NIS87646.1 hypothetical protein [Nitrospinaceae bacterium]NIT84513.1 hypothetical protein [Nitrospinaceae bacterium]NIU46703.1 hypothetical protein [Nitrospinaceae bacterium]
MNGPLRSYLDPHKILLLESKLEQGEISPEECKEILKRIMLKEYERKTSATLSDRIRTWIQQFGIRWNATRDRIRDRHFAEPSLDPEEMEGTVRSRHLELTIPPHPPAEDLKV